MLLFSMTCLAAPVAVLLAGAADDAGPRRFESLTIVDAAGNPRIELGPTDAGYGIVIRDEDGAFHATLTDAPGGAVVQLRNPGGDLRLMATDEATGISIRDAAGRPRAVLSVTGEESQMEIRDVSDKVLFEFPE